MQLISKQTDNYSDGEQSVDRKPIITSEQHSNYEKRAKEINQQFIDLELAIPDFEAESDESELELWKH